MAVNANRTRLAALSGQQGTMRFFRLSESTAEHIVDADRKDVWNMCWDRV